MRKKLLFIFISLYFIFYQCAYSVNYNKPITIFLHGTLYPGVNFLIRTFDLPLGLVSAIEQGNRFLHGRIAYILNQADPERFPLNNFYFFGWSGGILPKSREKAAYLLYQSIKHFKCPIRIIAHSHGGNVALNLAKVVKECRDYNFKVDELILLACPVIALNEDHINSNIFKKIFSFYSTGDRTQTRDPQYLYSDTRRHIECTGKIVPFFSQRTFRPCTKLIQRRILYDRRNLQHMHFLYKPFLSRLPSLIDVVDKSVRAGFINNSSQEFILNIPRKRCCNAELLVKRMVYF